MIPDVPAHLHFLYIDRSLCSDRNFVRPSAELVRWVPNAFGSAQDYAIVTNVLLSFGKLKKSEHVSRVSLHIWDLPELHKGFYAEIFGCHFRHLDSYLRVEIGSLSGTYEKPDSRVLLLLTYHRRRAIAVRGTA